MGVINRSKEYDARYVQANEQIFTGARVKTISGSHDSATNIIPYRLSDISQESQTLPFFARHDTLNENQDTIDDTPLAPTPSIFRRCILESLLL